jgi:prepilin-type N-terminal cleavage/methylation domain-containing protein
MIGVKILSFLPKNIYITGISKNSKFKKIMNFLNKKQNKSGFTLIELVVVISVFLLVMGTAIGIFISVIENQKKISAEQEIISQASYVIEYMSKALRMAKTDLVGDVTIGGCLGLDYKGYNYLFTKLDSSTNKYFGIKFINQSDNNACVEFFLDNTDPNNIVLKEIKNNGEAVNFTSSKLKINQAEFRINGVNNIGYFGSYVGQEVQPRVTIFLDVSMQSGTSQVNKKIQTTISQRNLNIQ